MRPEESRVKDPVCGMLVDAHDNAVTHMGMHFAFCSRQCKERFIANPHLYIAYQGKPAPKQEGREVIKRRRLRLEVVLPEDAARLVQEALCEMMGVKEVRIAGDSVEITYDLLQATAKQIEARLDEVGIKLGEGWSQRLRRAFIHESEEWEISSLEVSSHRGCH